MLRVLRSPLAPAAVVWIVLGLALVVVLARGHDARDFAFIDPRFVEQSHASPYIRLDPSLHYRPTGYDGQFFYYIALDPVQAWRYIDAPAYRYGRILYPLLARALALGRPSLVPFTLIAINWLAIGAGTLAVALWLRRRDLPAWPSLLFGFFPGFIVALERDLSEALAYCLAAWAILLFDLGAACLWLSAGVFALAALTRETTLVFPAFFALALFIKTRRLQTTAAWLAVVVLPYAAYRGFLAWWLDSRGTPVVFDFTVVPLSGLFRNVVPGAPWRESLLGVVIPGVICLALAIAALRRSVRDVAPWLLVVNALAFTVFLGAPSYADVYASSRINAGVVVASLLCLPAFVRLGRAAVAAYAGAAVCWLAILPFILRPVLHGL